MFVNNFLTLNAIWYKLNIKHLISKWFFFNQVLCSYSFFTLPELTRARNCCCSECRRNCGCSEYPTYFVYFSPLKADEFFGDGFSISFFIFSKFSKIEHQKHKYKSFELFWCTYLLDLSCSTTWFTCIWPACTSNSC